MGQCVSSTAAGRGTFGDCLSGSAIRRPGHLRERVVTTVRYTDGPPFFVNSNCHLVSNSAVGIPRTEGKTVEAARDNLRAQATSAGVKADGSIG